MGVSRRTGKKASESRGEYCNRTHNQFHGRRSIIVQPDSITLNTAAPLHRLATRDLSPEDSSRQLRPDHPSDKKKTMRGRPHSHLQRGAAVEELTTNPTRNYQTCDRRSIAPASAALPGLVC